MIKKPVRYKDRPIYPHITDKYEGELKQEFGNMLVNMSKDIGNKLNEILNYETNNRKNSNL